MRETKYNVLLRNHVLPMMVLFVLVSVGSAVVVAQDEAAYRKALAEAHLQADPSEHRATAFVYYLISLIAAGKGWPEARPLAAAKFNQLKEIDFYAAYLGVLRDQSYYSVSQTLFDDLPADQRAAVKTLSEWARVNSLVLKPVPPHIPYPAGVPRPGYGWGKTVTSNLPAAGATTQAEKDQKMADGTPAAGRVFYRSGVQKFENKDYAGAVADFDRCIRFDPKSADCYSHRGRSNTRLNKHEAAIADYTEEIRLRPGDFLGYNHRAVQYIELKKYDLAAADLTESVRLNTGANNSAARDTLVTVNKHLALTKEIEESKKTVDAFQSIVGPIVKNIRDADALMNTGNAQMQRKDHDAAITSYAECIKLVPAHSGCLIGRGNGYTQKVSSAGSSTAWFDMALADYDAAIKLAGPNLGLAYVNRGLLYGRVKKHDLAIADYNLALGAGLTGPNTQLAKDLLLQSQKTRAMEYITLMSNAFNRAIAFEKAGDAAGVDRSLSEAMEHMSKAIALDKTNPTYYLRRGILHRLKKNTDAAIADFKEGLKYDPGSADILNQLKSLGAVP